MNSIHLAGDSTVAPGPLDGTGAIGWGGVLHELMAQPVHNRAIGGATTASFVTEGRWAETLAAIEPGDVVVIQFGHNDQKEPELTPAGGYRDNLARFVEQVRAAGGRPVLVTSAERCLFDDDGELRVSHGAYPAAVRDLGERADAPVIDLTAFTRWLYTWLGQQGCADLFPHLVPDGSTRDTTHFGLTGARAIAGYVAQHLRALQGLDDDHEPIGKWGVSP